MIKYDLKLIGFVYLFSEYFKEFNFLFAQGISQSRTHTNKAHHFLETFPIAVSNLDYFIFHCCKIHNQVFIKSNIKKN
jgi:hypothetical protein